MQQLLDAIAEGHFILDLDERDFPSIFHCVIEELVKQNLIAGDQAEEVEAALLSREEQTSTAVGHAVAVPHVYLEGLKNKFVFFVRLEHAANFDAPDGIPTRFLVFLLGPPDSPALHLDTLAAVARIMSNDEFRYEAGEAESKEDLLAALRGFIDRTTARKTVVGKASEGLQYTGKFAGGFFRDVARKWPHYWSDFKDGLHPKCLAATMFLYFAVLAPVVTFGGVMALQTNGEIGAVEMIVSTAIGGVIYALFAGQPLNILGGTGPMLVFIAILYNLCDTMNLAFLPVYAWVGLWSAGFMLILAVTDASCLMRFFTRFTDEIFAALISMIFIFEAVMALTGFFEDLDVKQHHDTALLTLLLALGTLYIAISLSRFRRSSYLRPAIREFFSDFGPVIAMGAMTLVAIWLHGVDLKMLPTPDEFGTTSGRPWAVDIMAAPVWVRFASIGPAILLTVLVYLDHNITARIINSPDHKLQKGEGYHLDLVVVGGLMVLCSLFGLPWLVAATVRSLNHVRSLATKDDVVSPGGETRERVIHVRENRVTGLTIHLLIGASLLLLPLLKTIPMAVLYGLFLYMGIVSMSGNQFFERLSLLLKDPSLYPSTHYIRRVPNMKIHMFTLLQLGCLSLLWIVKSSILGILFPVFIALLVPVRIFAERFFSPAHLAALDAEEEPEDEQTHWSG